MEKRDLGISSKLQWPKLFMKSMYVMYPANDTTDAVPVSTVVSNGIAKSAKYDMCSANGWMTATTITILLLL